MFFDPAGVNLPDSSFSLVFFFLPFLISSLAFLAASRANFDFKDLSIISVAIFLFSSKKNAKFSWVTPSTALFASGLPNFDFVWPSNYNAFSGIFNDITAVKPSLTSEPSNDLSFAFIILLFLA